MKNWNGSSNISVDLDKLALNTYRIKKNNLKEFYTPLNRHPAISEMTAYSVDNHEVKNQLEETNNARVFIVGKIVVNRNVILGMGGSGKVYLGHSAQNKGNLLAVKVATDDSFKKSEVDVMQTMSEKSHANIVRLFEHSIEGALHYISMDYCNGGDLTKLLHEGGSLTIEETKSLSRQMADALCSLKTMNIVHRDIKLDNIFIHHPDEMNRKWQNRIYKIGDFGSSKYLPEGKLKRIVGTRGYWAPEVVMREGYTNMADLFSIGAVLFKCYFRRLPFKEEPIKDYLRQAKKGLSLQDSVDADFKNVLASLLQFSPGLRMNALEYFNHPFHKDAKNGNS